MARGSSGAGDRRRVVLREWPWGGPQGGKSPASARPGRRATHGAAARFRQMTTGRPLSNKFLDSGRQANICDELGPIRAIRTARRPSGGDFADTGRPTSKPRSGVHRMPKPMRAPMPTAGAGAGADADGGAGPKRVLQQTRAPRQGPMPTAVPGRSGCPSRSGCRSRRRCRCHSGCRSRRRCRSRHGRRGRGLGRCRSGCRSRLRCRCRGRADADAEASARATPAHRNRTEMPAAAAWTARIAPLWQPPLSS